MKTSVVFVICLLLAYSSYAIAHNKARINLNLDSNKKFALKIDPVIAGQAPLEPKSLDEMDSGEYTVIKAYDRTTPYYYTQGLTFAGNNILLESAGLYGESGMHYLNLDDMSVNNHYQLEGKYFGEGADFILNQAGEKEIYQLTWRERDVMIYDPTDLSRKRMLRLPAEIKEGWGLTKQLIDTNGQKSQNILITDGSANVYVCDPQSLAVKRTILVTDSDGNKIRNLNELEMVQGKLWANIYLSNNIAVIDLDTGKTDKIIDFTGLVDTARTNFWEPWTREYCLNGIAYNPDTDRLIVTGKKWTKLFEIAMKH